ncbi:unnamed protein product [Paramecium sonneborni]|uniref:Uncharacterized protein n=1 Tax=Paramecium sonneborni TaxID=65129 RepID=A0A8S1RTN2_9CILI|nr:unnamed protein product [Paramecium sonneborni]
MSLLKSAKISQRMQSSKKVEVAILILKNIVLNTKANVMVSLEKLCIRARSTAKKNYKFKDLTTFVLAVIIYKKESQKQSSNRANQERMELRMQQRLICLQIQNKQRRRELKKSKGRETLEKKRRLQNKRFQYMVQKNFGEITSRLKQKCRNQMEINEWGRCQLQGILQGFIHAGDNLAEHYLKQAQSMSPVLTVLSEIRVQAQISKGFFLGKVNIIQKSQNKSHENFSHVLMAEQLANVITLMFKSGFNFEIQKEILMYLHQLTQYQ